MSVAFITANFGAYESSCKPFKTQSIPCDFIYFTDAHITEPNGWQVDNEPWHEKIETPKGLRNSFENNSHPFNIAKFYKQNFQKIPRLQGYDMIIWIDGSIELTSETVAEECLALKSPIVIFKYNQSLVREVEASHIPKYTSISWNGHEQPYQDIYEQYEAYGSPEFQSIFITCFIAFDNRSPQVSEFLEKWYLDTLRYTTNDQISFVQLVQGLNVLGLESEDPLVETQFYTKRLHDGPKKKTTGNLTKDPFSMIRNFKQPENSYFVTVGYNLELIMHIKSLIGSAEVYHLQDASNLGQLVEKKMPKFISMVCILGIRDEVSLRVIDLFCDHRTEVFIF